MVFKVRALQKQSQNPLKIENSGICHKIHLKKCFEAALFAKRCLFDDLRVVAGFQNELQIGALDSKLGLGWLLGVPGRSKGPFGVHFGCILGPFWEPFLGLWEPFRVQERYSILQKAVSTSKQQKITANTSRQEHCAEKKYQQTGANSSKWHENSQEILATPR